MSYVPKIHYAPEKIDRGGYTGVFWPSVCCIKGVPRRAKIQQANVSIVTCQKCLEIIATLKIDSSNVAAIINQPEPIHRQSEQDL